MSEAMGIIHRAQQADLEGEAARIKLEREQRKALRLQADNTGLTGGELLNRLAGSAEEKPPDDDLTLPKETLTNEPQSRGFPPPPNAASKSR